MPTRPARGRRAAGADASAEVTAILQGLRQVVQALEDSSRELYLEYGLTSSQLWLLRTLAADGPIPAGALARRLALHPSTITALAERLEGRGLIAREREPDDRRFVRLRLTPAGSRLVARAPSTPQGRLVRALSRLPATRLRQLHSAVGDLVGALGAHEVVPLPLFTRLDR